MTPEPQPINVGLIGFGFAGRTFHAPVIRAVKGLRLAAILQRKGTEAASAYPDVRIARSVEELLASDSIQLVVIATPNVSHFDLARQCLLAGRHVVIDKPFATTYARGCGTGSAGGKMRTPAFGLSESPLRWRLQDCSQSARIGRSRPRRAVRVAL